MERALRGASSRRRRLIGGAAAAVAALAVIGGATLAPGADSVRDTLAGSPAGRTWQNRDIVIPFTVGPADCGDRARTYAVTMRIYNVLAQAVGIPTLAAADEPGRAAALVGRPLTRLVLPCGRYTAHWNGRHAGTGMRLAPGVYLYDLIIDGQRITRKVTLGR